MEVTTSIRLDLTRVSAPAVVHAVQGDGDTRYISAEVYDNGVEWNPPETAYAVVAIDKPDGTHAYYRYSSDGTEAVQAVGNTVTIQLAAQALTAAGDALAAVSYFDETEAKLSTFAFLLRIQPSPVPDGVLMSSDYYQLPMEQIAQATEAAIAARRWLDEIYPEQITDEITGVPLILNLAEASDFKPARIYGAAGMTSPIKIVVPGTNAFDQSAVTGYLLGSSYTDGVITTRPLNAFDAESYDIQPSVPNNNYLMAGNYILSFDARLASGDYGGTILAAKIYYMDAGSRKSVAGTAMNNPTMKAEYQRYTFSFAMPINAFVGWDFQIRAGAVNAVLNIKNVQIENGTAATPYTAPKPAFDVDFSPYTFGAADYIYYNGGWLINSGGVDYALPTAAQNALQSIFLPGGNSLVYVRGSQPTAMEFDQIIHSQVAHRMFYRKNADDIYVFSKYDAENDLCVRWKKKGGNNLFDIYQIIKIPNTKTAVVTSTDGGTILITTETDWHAPYRMRATANGNGSTSFNFTGGAHDSTGGGSGGIPTAETESLEMIADGVALPEVAAGWCDRLEFRWKNLVQGYNTGEADGFTPRYILSEMWQSVFDGYQWEQTARIVPLEEVYIIEYYGLENSGAGYWNESAYFVGSTGNRLINSLTAAISSNDKVAQELVRWGETDEMAMGIDKTYDIGDRSLYGGDTQKAIFTNSTTGKAYFNIIASQTLAANSVNSLRGYYIFRPKTI